MKIPNKIKVGAKEYTIEFVDDINDRGDLGMTTHSNLEIKIKIGKIAQMEQTFLHELVHCLANPLNEVEVEYVSTMLQLFIRDNPGVFK